MAKPRILIVGAINRPDILRMFAQVGQRAELHFLDYHFNPSGTINPALYQPYGAVHCWHQFRSARQLLRRLRPDKVVFFYIESYNQVALHLAAKAAGIPVYHLEHGLRLRFAAFQMARDALSPPRRSLADYGRQLSYSVRNYAFLFASIGQTGTARRRFTAYLLEGFRHGLSLERLRAFADIRQPDLYISFSAQNFDFIRHAYRVTEFGRPVVHIGIPQFDAYFPPAAAHPDAGTVLFVGSQLHNHGYLGWNQDNYGAFVRQLVAMVHAHGMRLRAKLHPLDRHPVWSAPDVRAQVEVVDDTALRADLPTTGLVLGFFSTMLLPLIAMPHTALIALEMHPQPPVTAQADDFVAAGVAVAATHMTELDDWLGKAALLRTQQQPNKPAFVRQFLHLADGQAGVRLADQLVTAATA